MQNIFKSTYRNFVRKPAINLINLVGLAVSLALVIILSVYSYSELTTDNYHKNGNRVYLFGDLKSAVSFPAPLKDKIDMNLPGVESTVRISGTWNAPVFQAENKESITSDLIFADDDFFKLFTYRAIEGDLASALKTPMSVVITKSMADKLLGNEPAVGKTLKLNNSHQLTITAVIDKPEGNTCLSFNAITSNATKKIVQPNGDEFTSWMMGGFMTFVLLKEGINPDLTAKSIYSLLHEDNPKINAEFGLNPLNKIYFSKFNLFGGNYIRFGEKAKVLILLMVAALVLMIALVNFINISSSQWFEKIKQNGIMKVLGAKRSTIMRNVLIESVLFFLVAFFLATGLIVIVKPLIQEYTGIHFNSRLIYSPGFILIFIAGTIILSMLFSFGPALRISSSRVVDNLKKKVETRHSGFSFSGVFVTFQFIVAIVLIAFTALVQKQVRFGSDFGVSQENLVGIKLTPELSQKKDVLKQLLMEKSSVESVSYSMYFPGSRFSNWGTKLNLNGEEKDVTVDMFNADASVFKTMGLELKMGRIYSDDLSTDQGKIVVNEAFLRNYGITNPVGGKMVVTMDGKSSEIIGVVKDFHFKSVTQPITPLVITNGWYTSYCLVKLQTSGFNNFHSALLDIKSATTELSPSFHVEISFFDQAIENLYQSKLQFRRTFTLFAGCAIIICCLGILAMSLFACQRRIKEIGIRKVNGARISEVMTMLNKDFVKWVAIAFVIATPIAYYAMHKWLENFAYKTSLSWWIFALAGLLALGIALLTVSWQSWRAATRNPVEALRYE
jgi:putative ABC transport system permease protein